MPAPDPVFVSRTSWPPCDVMWSSHSQHGNRNCAFPAFYLLGVGDAYVQMTTPQHHHWGKGQCTERAPRKLCGQPLWMGEESEGVMDQEPSAHPRPVLHRLGTDLWLKHTAQPVWGHTLQLSQPDFSFWTTPRGIPGKPHCGLLSLAGGHQAHPPLLPEESFRNEPSFERANLEHKHRPWIHDVTFR